MFINGTADQLLPYDGGAMINGALVESVADSVASWVARNGTAIEADVDQKIDLTPEDDSTVTVSTYHAESNGTEVVHVEVVGGGHTEPSVSERITGPVLTRIGPQNADIEMAEVVWAFFADKTGDDALR